MQPLVGIIMGSTSDWETLRHAAETLEKLRDRGLQVLIAGAGGAAHLPGMAASKTSLPVLGVPVQSKTLNGLDSLLSIVQMPAGIPVGTLAIGVAGATNAALLAASIVGLTQPAIRAAVDAFRAAPARRLRMKIGIIGAGQLGQMLALAGFPLALQFRFLDSSPGSPGAQVAPIVVGAFDDIEALRKLAGEVDIVTYEFENVPVAALHEMAATRPCFPPVDALRVSQDRILEKELFSRLGIPTPPYRAVDTLADLEAGVAALGLPCVLKTRRLGYDGRGQRVLKKRADVGPAWEALGSVPLILEGFVKFDREVSIIGARSTRGETRSYPIVTNTHREGILRVTVAPTRDARLQRAAEGHLRRVLDHFGYAGVLTIEFFVAGGRLIANEMAPRVHNSGHWTIEGAVTSQFENHLRAILGLPLGDTRPVGHAAMVNYIGTMPDRDRVLALPGAHHHDYGKAPRANRKLGHCTVVAPTAAQRDAVLGQLLRRIPR